MNIIIKVRKGATLADKGRLNTDLKTMKECYPEIIESIEYEKE